MDCFDTTTWKNRNYDRLQKLKQEAVSLSLHTPTIMDIGPGGIVDFLLRQLPQGRKSDWSPRQKMQRGVVRLVEGVLRRTNIFTLETSEPEEIARLFGDINPTCIYIVDINSKVIEAVKRIIEGKGLPYHFEYALIDVSSHQIPYRADIVIAYNVIQRTKDWKASLNNIANSVRPGGLLSIRTGRNEKTRFLDENLHSFGRIDEGLYQKILG